MEWGPELWAGFHNLAKSSDRESLLKYWNIIPCKNCADNFKQLVEEFPPPFNTIQNEPQPEPNEVYEITEPSVYIPSNSGQTGPTKIYNDDLYKWSVMIHNEINKKLSKSVYIDDQKNS